MLKKFGSLLFISLFLFAVTSCKDDDEVNVSDLDPGTFKSTITGIEGEDTGSAICATGIDTDSGLEIFVMILTSGREDGTHFVFARKGGIPGKGNHPIQLLEDFDVEDEDEDWILSATNFVSWCFKISETQAEWYFSKSGTIKVESSGSDRLTGSFDFNADGLKFNYQDFTEVEVQAQFKGGFNAMIVNFDNLPDFGDKK